MTWLLVNPLTHGDSMTDLNSLRPRFEKWASTVLQMDAADLAFDTERNCYSAFLVHTAWQAYRQAAAEILAPAPIKLPTDEPAGCVCDMTRNPPAASMCGGCPHRALAAAHDLDCWRMLMELRQGEGDSVEILADNCDFGFGHDRAVVCCGDWTGYKLETFGGRTLLECLSAAVAARRGAEVRVATGRGAEAFEVARSAADRLLGWCADHDVVLTIDRRPLPPLAMGHATSEVSVRVARNGS